jgi:hypothetical protein
LSGFDWLPRRILSEVNDRRGFAMFKTPDEGNYRSCRRDAPQEEPAFDIVDEVRQSDLRRRSRDPDGPDEQTHPILLLGEDMLENGFLIWRCWRAGSLPASGAPSASYDGHG